MIENKQRHLQRLNLENNACGDLAAEYLCRALMDNNKMLYLNLSKNKITDRGAFCVADMLRHNRSLLVLFLHWNKICSKGGVAIAKALYHNNSLQVFDFSFNNVGSTKEHECAKAFAACFESNTSLLHVDMSSDLFDREDVTILNEGLTKNHTILGIHMGGNKGKTDPLGFVNPLAENDEAECHVFTRI